MIHAGNAITVQMLSDGIAEFRFDLQGESVNKFNRATIEDFQAAIAAVKANDIKGLVVTSVNLHLSLVQILLNLVKLRSR
jgi:3-hydroxyacyl-CoA dehydrogenase/enoyl-CoA hydratase/3-hydroxybutyryl-CoA epimerase/enoyl-CoA isomerase